MDQDLQVEKTLRAGVCLRWSTIHSSSVAHVDRLPRHTGRLHASQVDRLFRKQPARNLCAAGLRDTQPEKVCWVRALYLGYHGERWSRTGGTSPQWTPRALFRLQGAFDSAWSR